MNASFHYSDLFASIGDVTVAVLANLSAVGTALFGFKKFQLPYENTDGFPRGITNCLLFVPFILCFLFITPENAKLAALIVLAGILLGYVCFTRYGRAFRNHRYVKPVPSGWKFWMRHREEVIVGGTVLTADAQARIATTHQTIQELLATAAYDPDTIWERPSRIEIQQRVERWFYAFLFCAVISVVAASLSLQALISQTSPLAAATRLWSAYQQQEAANDPSDAHPAR